MRKYYQSVFLEIKVLPSLLVLSQRFFFQSATKFFPLLPITPCNELNAIWMKIKHRNDPCRWHESFVVEGKKSEKIQA